MANHSVYLAGRDYAAAESARASLEAASHTIVSTWHAGTNYLTNRKTDAQQQALAVAAKIEMSLADSIVFIDSPPDQGDNRPERAAAIGVGLALGKTVYIVNGSKELLALTSGVIHIEALSKLAALLTAASLPSATGSVVIGKYPASIGATANGIAADMGAVNTDVLSEPSLAILNVGAVTGTNPTLDVTIQEATDSAFTTPTAVVLDAVFTQVVASNSLQVRRFSRTKQYVRAVYTIGGTAGPTFITSVVFAKSLLI